MANTQQRTAADIEKEIASARDSLAEGIAALVDEVHPKAVARRGIASAREIVGRQAGRVRAQFTDSDGRLITKRVAMVSSAVAGLIAFILVIRAIVHH